MPELVPIAKRVQTMRELLDKMKPALAAALPKTLSAERLARVVLTECLASVQRAQPGRPTLLDCTSESVAGAVLQCAQLGLEPGVLGQAYLIPFRNSRRGTVECSLITGYRGLLALARRSGQILTIEATVVHEKDRYTVTKGTKPAIHHVPFVPTPEQAAGPEVAYYAVAMIRGGGVQFESLWHYEVLAHRDRFARAAGDGPWVTDFDAMALKTVLRKLCKFLPLSIEAQTAVALDETAEAGLPQELGLQWLSEAPAVDQANPVPEGVPTAPSKLEAALANRKRVEAVQRPAPEPAA